MKNKFKWISIVLVAMLVFAAVGCENEPKEGAKKSSEALLTGISFGAGDTITNTIGEAIPEADYYGLSNLGSLTAAQLGKIELLNAASLAKPVALQISNKAAALMAKATGNAVPDDFSIISGETIPSLATNNYFAVEVRAENKKTTNYYVFQVRVLGASATCSGVKVGNVSATLGTSATSWGSAGMGSILLDDTTKNGALTATASAGTTIEYGIAANAAAAVPELSATAPAPSGGSFTDENIIYIKVTSESKEVANFYKVEVHMGRDASLSSFAIGTVQATLGTPATGTPTDASKWSTVTAGRIALTSVTKSGALLAVATAGATIEYGIANSATAAVPTLSATAPTTWNFVDGNVIYIKATSKNTKVANYYKVTVEMGRDATLSSVKIGGTPASLGVPQATANNENLIAGKFIAKTPSDFSFAITATANDAATVTYINKSDDSVPADAEYGSAALTLADGDTLYVKATAVLAVLYYKIEIVFVEKVFILTITDAPIGIGWASISSSDWMTTFAVADSGAEGRFVFYKSITGEGGMPTVTDEPWDAEHGSYNMMLMNFATFEMYVNTEPLVIEGDTATLDFKDFVPFSFG